MRAILVWPVRASASSTASCGFVEAAGSQIRRIPFCEDFGGPAKRAGVLAYDELGIAIVICHVEGVEAGVDAIPMLARRTRFGGGA